MINRVLIIEDETELSGLIKFFLSKKLYEVTCAENISSAVSLLRSNFFDTIILDNNLPDGKGLDIIPIINCTQNKPKIIAMSALQIREEAFIAGASYYIEKPISLAEIYLLLNI